MSRRGRLCYVDRPKIGDCDRHGEGQHGEAFGERLVAAWKSRHVRRVAPFPFHYRLVLLVGTACRFQITPFDAGQAVRRSSRGRETAGCRIPLGPERYREMSRIADFRLPPRLRVAEQTLRGKYGRQLGILVLPPTTLGSHPRTSPAPTPRHDLAVWQYDLWNPGCAGPLQTAGKSGFDLRCVASCCRTGRRLPPEPGPAESSCTPLENRRVLTVQVMCNSGALSGNRLGSLAGAPFVLHLWGELCWVEEVSGGPPMPRTVMLKRMAGTNHCWVTRHEPRGGGRSGYHVVWALTQDREIVGWTPSVAAAQA
jgi:hypothetical protein